MALDVTTYTGNAGLGLGSNASIPAPVGDKALDILNNTVRDIMLLDNQKNIQLFQQKVKDRDNLNNLILSNQVATGDILPEYQPHFDEAKKRVEDVFRQWKGNQNDVEGYRKYQGAVQDLKDVAAHAQVNTHQLRQLEAEKAQQTLPGEISKYQTWIDRQKKQDFWTPITPYQKLHDFAIDDILKFAQPKTRSVQGGKDPFGYFDESYFDYNDILKNARNAYVNDREAADSVDQFYDKLQQYNPQQLNLALDAIDQKIDQYNKERGTVIPKVNRQVDQQGRPIIGDSKIEFAAKYALANQSAFSTKTPKFNKDIAKYNLDKDKLALQAKRLGIDAAKAGAYIRNLNAKTKKFVEDQQAQGTNVAQQYEDFINGIQPQSLKITQSNGASERQDIVFTDKLPQGYQFINGPIMATDKKGVPTGKITVGQLKPFIAKNNKRPYYIPKYVNSATGEELTTNSDFVKQTFQNWKGQRYKGNVNDMLKTLMKNGGVELILQGANGAANYTSMSQSAKALNAIGTTKGEENIMNPPTSIPEEQDIPEPEQ